MLTYLLGSSCLFDLIGVEFDFGFVFFNFGFVGIVADFSGNFGLLCGFYRVYGLVTVDVGCLMFVFDIGVVFVNLIDEF